MPERLVKSRVHPWADAVIGFTAVWIASVIRFGVGPIFAAAMPLIWPAALIAAVIRPLALASMGVYSIFWRNVGPREIGRLVAGVAAGSVVMAVALWLLRGAALIPMFSRSLIAIDFFMSLILYGLFRRVVYLSTLRKNGNLAA